MTVREVGFCLAEAHGAGDSLPRMSFTLQDAFRSIPNIIYINNRKNSSPGMYLYFNKYTFKVSRVTKRVQKDIPSVPSFTLLYAALFGCVT